MAISISLGGKTAGDGSARGMIVHTNQIGFASHFGFDEGGRKIVETNANLEIVRYTNNAAGDLLFYFATGSL